jgi:hypothetical protein
MLTAYPYQKELYGGPVAVEILFESLTWGACSHEAVTSRLRPEVGRPYCSELIDVFKTNAGFKGDVPGRSSSDPQCSQFKRTGAEGPDLRTLAGALGVPTDRDSLVTAFDAICKGDNFVPLGNVGMPEDLRVPDPTRIARFAEAIDNVLDAPLAMPVGLRFCLDFLTTGRADEVDVDPATGKYEDSCDNRHAAVVIGRRAGPRGCQYLVMNSWGEGCGLYDRRWDCEAGKVWVDARSLLQNTASLFFLDPNELAAALKRAGE